MGLMSKAAGRFLLKLNMKGIPISNKYHEGKMKRIARAKLKEPEIV